jgi:hypothetical protein
MSPHQNNRPGTFLLWRIRMHALLDQEAPGLAKKLESLSPEAWRKILARACLRANERLVDLGDAARNLLQSLRVHGVLSGDEVKESLSLAEAADAKYLALQEQNADQNRILKFFSEARLLTAMAIGFGGAQPKHSADAVYELLKTVDDPSDLIRVIESDVDLFANS